MLRAVVLWLGSLVGIAPPAFAETIPGPVPAIVERVVDGDTVAVRARIWLGLDIHVLVRVRGIDAPELRGRCPEERRRAVAASDRVADALAGGPVVLSRIEDDKFHGRVLADVKLGDGRDLSAIMLASGSARPYHGGPRGAWC